MLKKKGGSKCDVMAIVSCCVVIPKVRVSCAFHLRQHIQKKKYGTHTLVHARKFTHVADVSISVPLHKDGVRIQIK